MFKSAKKFETELNNLTVPNGTFYELALERQSILTKPKGSLGRLEELACFMAMWQETERPRSDKAQVLVFAGNHGACDQGINPFPQEITLQMVENFKQGGAAINQLALQNGAKLKVILLADGKQTSDFTKGPAMSQEECLDALNVGADSVDLSSDILLLGEMGIGNSTISAALCLASFGGQSKDWVGGGTGSDLKGIELKRKVIDLAHSVNAANLGSSFETLCALGGREQAAICGALVAARKHRIPVLLDGFIACSAVAPLSPHKGIFDHVLVGHKSAELGHTLLLKNINKVPILDLDMCLGEGTGSAVALAVIKSAVACHNGMATFAEAGLAVK
tara:strand:+ start:142 stop:1146 length:1005 start_codon:yes stop_codon:yes gene_type:complete